MIPIAEWAARGYPGSVDGNTGKVNGARPYDDWLTVPAKPRPVCSASECDRLAANRGLCWKHYENQRVRNRRQLDVRLHRDGSVVQEPGEWSWKPVSGSAIVRCNPGQPISADNLR